MKIRLLTCIIFSLAVFFTSCKDSDSFTISGTLTNTGKIGKVTLLLADSTGASPIDSVEVSGGKFTFKHKAPYASLYKLRIAGRVFDFVAQNGDDIKFNTDLNDVAHNYEISGSEPSERIKEFNRISNIYGEKNGKIDDNGRKFVCKHNFYKRGLVFNNAIVVYQAKKMFLIQSFLFQSFVGGVSKTCLR